MMLDVPYPALVVVLAVVCVACAVTTLYVTALLVYDEWDTRNDGWRSYARGTNRYDPTGRSTPIVPNARRRTLPPPPRLQDRNQARAVATPWPTVRPHASGAARAALGRASLAA